MLTPTTAERRPIDSLRPLVHEALQPLFDHHNPCLPALEKTCQTILSLTGITTGADQLANVISRDPGLTCKVLQVANSIAYSPQHVIGTVPHAVSWLGLDTIRSMVTAAKLVEHLRHCPDRQRIVSSVIERALMAAVHANELGSAMEHASLSQLFSSTLLYLIGDLAVAYQAPELYLQLRRIPLRLRSHHERVLEETALLGVPKFRLAKALAQLWALPPHVAALFSIDVASADRRWHSGVQMFGGLVVGSAALVDALSLRVPAAIESAKRSLVIGTGLPPPKLGDILVRALDRGKQLLRSAGLSSDHWGDPEGPSRAPQPTPMPEPAPSVETAAPRGPSAMETKPLETLQTLQAALQEAKDLNSLLGTLVQALHRDAGFSRVALALLNPNDSDQLTGRLAMGVTPMIPHLEALSGSLSDEHPYFLELLKRPWPTLVGDVAAQKTVPLNHTFVDRWKPGTAIIAPLRIGQRPIGMIYCDCGPRPAPIRHQDFQNFQLFFGQSTLSMNRLAGVL
jgi:hypothetical protein